MAIPHGQIVAISTPPFAATVAGDTAFAGFSFTAPVQPLGVQMVCTAAANVTKAATVKVRQVLVAGSSYIDVLAPTSTRALTDTDRLSYWGPPEFGGLSSTLKRAGSNFPYQLTVTVPATASTLTLIATLFVFVP